MSNSKIPPPEQFNPKSTPKPIEKDKIKVQTINVKNVDVENSDVENIDVKNIKVQNVNTSTNTPIETPVQTYKPAQHKPPSGYSTVKSPPIPKGTPNITDTQKQNKLSDKLPFEWSFLLPQYWGIWLVFGLFMLLIRLPLRYQFWMGRKLGIGTYHLAKTRQRDTLINLKLAFPEKPEVERELMAKQVFVNQGIGIFETLCAWYRPNVFTRTISISGLQHVVNAQKEGRGVLILGAHYTMLDLGGRLGSQFFPADGMYRPQNNKLLNWFVYNGRRSWVSEQIGHRDMPLLTRRLKEGNTVWYAADQDFGLKRGVMAPFFGVPAATITTPRYLAGIENAQGITPAIIGLHTYRQTPDNLPRGKRPHYHVTLTPPLENYPSNSEVADATKVNEMYEGLIRIDPTQWMWFHRRYKHSETGRSDYYK